MPIPAETLTPQSNDKDVQEAIGLSIEMCMKEGGRTQEQCAAIAYSVAREKTGRELNYGRQR